MSVPGSAGEAMKMPGSAGGSGRVFGKPGGSNEAGWRCRGYGMAFVRRIPPATATKLEEYDVWASRRRDKGGELCDPV